jgi:uncharacterized protein (DUF2249 family)
MIIEDRDPRVLLDTLRPVLEPDFDYWIPEDGPHTWRILVFRHKQAPSARRLRGPDWLAVS